MKRRTIEILQFTLNILHKKKILYETENGVRNSRKNDMATTDALKKTSQSHEVVQPKLVEQCETIGDATITYVQNEIEISV